jgi:uncharacterized protein (DUF433 family)
MSFWKTAKTAITAMRSRLGVTELYRRALRIARERSLPARAGEQFGTMMVRGVTPMAFDRITVNLARMGGQPCIRNMRLTVRRVVEVVALYPDRAELRREYPELEDEDIRQALNYAASYLGDRIIELPLVHATAS